MGDDEKPDFTFVDKRRTAEPASGEAAREPAAEEVEDRPAEESRLADEAVDETAGAPLLPALSMRDRMLMCIDILGQGAWIAMGLIADPASGEIKKDLGAARDAIDCVALLAEKLEPSLEDSVRREMKNLVSDLRVNFVQQSTR